MLKKLFYICCCVQSYFFFAMYYFQGPIIYENNSWVYVQIKRASLTTGSFSVLNKY